MTFVNDYDFRMTDEYYMGISSFFMNHHFTPLAHNIITITQTDAA